MSLAVVVIASEKRKDTTFLPVVQSCIEQYPDQLVVVADFPWPYREKWRHYHVPALTRTTIDALVKRDVGWIATDTESIMYLSDDHRLGPDFIDTFKADYATLRWDILVPSRFCMRTSERVALNMGQAEGYCGGHGGIYRRRLLHYCPWSATPHHPNWDVIHTHQHVKSGARLRYAWPDLAIEDIEPGAEPWR